jgi:peptide/nickel transport system substrate-binding protein
MPNPPTRGYVARLGSGLVPTKCCRRLVPALAAVVLLASACTGDPAPPASGDPAGTSLVIAVADEPAELNPLDGYAEHGAAKIFEGLVEHDADSSLRPVLAADLPEPSTDGRTWTVKLRPGVTFTDGTPFEAADVVATYRALLSPARHSPVRQRFAMLKSVTALDQATVEFTLSAPYAPFPDLLVLGILPSESLTGAAAPEPVGTGPYQLSDWQHGNRIELAANKTYWDGAPAIKKVTVEFIPDDDTRAERLRDGKLDGAALPPVLAKKFDNTDGLRVVSHSAADMRAVVLPADGPVTGDPSVRLALNHAMNREQMVTDVLAGQGSVAYTPMPRVLAEFLETDAAYDYDITTALDQLDASGWVTAGDGIRAKGKTVAQFTLHYPAGDTVSAGLAEAFATNARSIGVQVDLEPVSTGTPTGAMVVGFGNPFDPDLALYDLLRSGKTALGGSVNETVDSALDTGRAATDPAQRATAYRRLQRAYVTEPGLVVLAEPNHTYVMRESWDGYEPVVDADGPSMSWGAWWNLEKWTPR